MNLFCIELGVRQRKNLCRMTTSVVVPGTNSADIQRTIPPFFEHGTVQRVFEAEHVIVNWPIHSIDIVEKEHSGMFLADL